MTAKASRPEAHVSCHANDNLVFERDHPPAPVWFAGMVLVMNVLSAMLSLTAW
jgi:hypothetical protein